jgi:hypothetical protein
MEFLHTAACSTSNWWHVNMECWWNDNWQGKSEIQSLRKTCLSATFVHHKYHMDYPGTENRPLWWQDSNCLSCDDKTATVWVVMTRQQLSELWWQDSNWLSCDDKTATDWVVMTRQQLTELWWPRLHLLSVFQILLLKSFKILFNENVRHGIRYSEWQMWLSVVCQNIFM